VIRINLLAVERKAAKPARAAIFQAGQKMVIGCSAILILSVLFVGWRYWSLTQQGKQLDKNIADSQQETLRLRSLIMQVQQFEQQKTQLQQRVVLIEQLRKEQKGPVHMLDEISRALPPMLWLTELKQTDDSVVIEGRSTAVTNLTDFVANLEASGYFKKSIDIVSSQAEPATGSGQPDLVKFSIKAQFQPPPAPAQAAKKGP
jgi:type IV pilus assembly protein PilN